MSKEKVAKLDCVFIRRFKKCLAIMFPSWTETSTILLVLLLGLSFLQQALYYNSGLIPSQYIQVLVDEDHAEFQNVVFNSIVIIISTALVKSLVMFVGGILYINWRGSLTKFIHKFYFADDNYYKLNVLQRDIDNLDQRITQDVDKFCKEFSTIFSTLVISPFIIGYYTYQCYDSTKYIGVVSIYGYFILGTIFNKILMSPIIKLVFQQEKLEGNFRFKHMQIRVNAESTAFYNSSLLEEKRTNIKLENLLRVQYKLIAYQLFLQCSVNFFDYSGSIVSYIVVSIPVFRGDFHHLDAGERAAVISKYSFVSIYLVNSFSQLIDLSNKISDIAGYIFRIGEVLEYFKDNKKSFGTSSQQGTVFIDNDDDLSDGVLFKLRNITYSTPFTSDKQLVKDLNLEIVLEENILINGKTGSGKTSLLRILSGISQPDFGNILRKKSVLEKLSVLFLPQKPLLTDGSLKQQVIYPEDEDACLDDLLESRRNEKIEKYLELVNMTEVCQRVGGIDHKVEWNWEDVLSPGEMQRLSFARLFYHQPVCAVLDEATSALDVETEKEMYQLCQSFEITLVSVGHRDSLHQFHRKILFLDGNGGWLLHALPQS
ncbi:lysosomal cobalamin transporter ABCD4-like [Xenia sp. Carnegie-2017]|uniref:lysosomal cobalamin transporter ABCD4-like n=1 Tax=Xenia sp. Carnegie-2017 TaxID=2897299 RepID=UPI001F04E3AA|nr:lysosomal cobalamin transporter ABCD4-like [Xenia sp. Carnegie-2017]